jgi:hypothetical protein
MGLVQECFKTTYHLARAEDEGGALGVANSHNYGSKTLWIILSVPSM